MSCVSVLHFEAIEEKKVAEFFVFGQPQTGMWHNVASFFGIAGTEPKNCSNYCNITSYLSHYLLGTRLGQD